jgi:hypothetical protein
MNRHSFLSLPSPEKHGVNDLSRWKQFGGQLDRPAPPPPSTRKEPQS